MWKYTIALLIATTSAHAAVQTVSPKDATPSMAPPAVEGASVQNYMMISPSARALDYQTAFEQLRKEKTAGKVYFQLVDGTSIANIIDMSIMPNSTLIVFRFNSTKESASKLLKWKTSLTFITKMTFHLLRLKSYPIYEQLLLEEMLLRSDSGNWCLINEGSSTAIVMGISGKKEELIDCAKAAQNGIPLIKRFSGGGTVIVDENTLFITFICQKHLHPFSAYPEPIMKWTEELYRGAFQHPEFRLRENDYVIGDRKFGGNARYIKRYRWLDHTSMLWDQSAEENGIFVPSQKNTFLPRGMFP